jgi:plasmid stabilization system protein ParE
MDELQVLKEFRGGIAGGGDEARERTIAAIRRLVEQEAAVAPRAGRPRASLPHLRRLDSARRRVLAAVVAATVIAALLAVLPMRRSSPSLVGQALAAIGAGGVLHVVGETSTGKQLLDLRSGKSTPVMQQEEIWFDESRGLRRSVTRIGGTVVDDTFLSPDGGWTPHGVIYDCTWIAAHPRAATKARVSCNLSGDNGTTPHDVPRPKPTLDPGLAGFVDGYRNALSSGAARTGGQGVVDGRTVDWLVLDTKQGAERVALDLQTHKPILIEGPNTTQMRITAIETVDSAAGRFRKPSPDETPVGPSLGKSIDKQTLAPTAAAIGAGFPGAVWAGPSVGILPLASATVQRLVSSYYHHSRPTESGLGLQLQYGSLLANGRRDWTKPYVTVSVAPSPTLAMAYMWPEVGGITSPTEGTFYFEPIRRDQTGAHGLAIGFTTIGGRAVAVQASSNSLLLAAARSLTTPK